MIGATDTPDSAESAVQFVAIRYTRRYTTGDADMKINCVFNVLDGRRQSMLICPLGQPTAQGQMLSSALSNLP